MEKNSKKDRHRYDDMIGLPHHVSPSRPPMPVSERAAQFSPFAALTGFGEAIRETERLTAAKVRLEEDARNALDEKLQVVQEHIADQPQVSVTYFQPDARKDGGAYVTATGQIKKIDTYGRMLVMQDGTRIPADEILEMEGELFSGWTAI